MGGAETAAAARGLLLRRWGVKKQGNVLTMPGDHGGRFLWLKIVGFLGDFFFLSPFLVTPLWLRQEDVTYKACFQGHTGFRSLPCWLILNQLSHIQTLSSITGETIQKKKRNWQENMGLVNPNLSIFPFRSFKRTLFILIYFGGGMVLFSF